MQNDPSLVSQAKIKPSREGLPVSETYDDFYFSTDNALEEKHHVFIQNNHLDTRFNALEPNRVFTVGELGFGTGLNFLLTVKTWLENSSHKQAYLRFISIEQHPLNLSQLEQACALWPELKSLCEVLIKHYPVIQTAGFHHVYIAQWRVTLTLIFDDAHRALYSLSACPSVTTFESKQVFQKAQSPQSDKNSTEHIPNPVPNHHAAIDFSDVNNKKRAMGNAQIGINCWFFDGFSPAKNPAMWQQKIFIAAAKISHEQATYATFTSASFVRKNIESAGFSVKKTVGYGKKREMIKGELISANLDNTKTPMAPLPTANKQHNNPPSQAMPQSMPQAEPETLAKPSYRKKNSAAHFWHLQKAEQNKPVEHVCVIGAGIAGAHIAHALALKNIKVSVFDKSSQIASGASGNTQGVVYTKLSPKDDHLSVFNVSAQLFADRFYHQHDLFNQCGQSCGIVHLAINEKTKQNYITLAQKLNSHYIQWQDNPSDTAGITLNTGGLVLPESGWLNPITLCNALLSHENITVHLNTEITRLKQCGIHWQLLNNDNVVSQCDNVVISSAYESTQFEQTAHLSHKAIRGQVTHFKATSKTQQLKTVLCGHGYIAPAANSTHCAGATFNLGQLDLTPTEADDQKNQENLLHMSADLDFSSTQSSKSRAAFRTATPDYFPIVGGVAKAHDSDGFIATFAPYTKRGNALITQPAHHYKGLYVNMGYGSRGLAYAPICSAMLCHQITGELLPTSVQTAMQLHPSRFLYRDLVKGKT